MTACPESRDESLPLPAAAAVLAGGASRRMGRDKASLSIGGERLLDRVLGRIRPVFAEVAVAGGGTAREIPPGVGNLPDPVAGAGPLAGLAAALAWSPRDWCFALACDMPDVGPRLIRFLWGLRADFDAVVPVAGGRDETLHAFYHRRCAPAARERLASGGARSLHGFLEELYVRRVSPEEWGGVDPEGRSFRNLNTPEDARAFGREEEAV